MFSRRSREMRSGEISGRISNGFSTGSDSDLKLDESTIKAVEASLREALTLNNEEARALLGRIEYQKENFEAALHIFQGIQLDNIFPRIRSLPIKSKHKRGKPPIDASQGLTMPAALILIEAVYLKIKTLEQLGRIAEAAQESKSLVRSFDATFPTGLPDHLKGTKIQEYFSKILETLPDLYKRQGLFAEAISAYRRGLRNSWEPSSGALRSLQAGLAVLLLYGGVEGPMCPKDLYNVDFVPSNNVEEALLLLMTIAKKSWDPEIMEHLCFALSICDRFDALAQAYESVLPGIYNRCDRWYNLTLSYAAAKEQSVALNLLRKSLNEVEKPNNVPALLHAASICSRNIHLAAEGELYSRRALENSEGATEYLKGRAWCLLGIVLKMKANLAASNAERAQILKEAISAWQEAAKVEKMDADIVFHLGVLYAEQGNLKVAMSSAKRFLELSGGSSKGWRFLALVLSAQERYEEAEMVLDAALLETNKLERGELLLTKAKLQIAQARYLQALETYKLVLPIVQAQPSPIKLKNTRVSELVLWQEMAGLFTLLSQWNDAESCLEKAKLLNMSSAETWFKYGNLYMAQKKNDKALAAFSTALVCDPEHVASKVLIGAVLFDSGEKSLPAARSFLNDALHAQPRNPSAWFHLGVLHETEGRLDEAADCFQTAYMLDQCVPVESFDTLQT